MVTAVENIPIFDGSQDALFAASPNSQLFYACEHPSLREPGLAVALLVPSTDAQCLGEYANGFRALPRSVDTGYPPDINENPSPF